MNKLKGKESKAVDNSSAKKVCFLILHYQTIEDTKECINSILANIEYENYNIIVVDNGSPNGTGKKLVELYKNNPKVKIIISENNLGFARGNNLGFKYIKNNFNADFIVMINNDTIMQDQNFIKKIIEEYEREPYHILGPKIISLVNQKNQNPMPVTQKSIKEVKRNIFKLRILLLSNYLRLEGFLRKIKETLIKKVESDDLNQVNDYMLHGSCLVFSKDYIKKYDGLYDRTFLYGEENILYFISKRDNLKMRYSENAFIYHKEDSATNSVLKAGNQKRRFFYKHSLNSLKELYKLMKESQNQG
jgi:GT2 family glycosyltransferase